MTFKQDSKDDKEVTFFFKLGALYKCQVDELLTLLFGGNIKAKPSNPRSQVVLGKKAPEGATWGCTELQSTL